MTLEVEREQVVQNLCAAYAQDHLSTGELESRLERVFKATDRAELQTLLVGVPAPAALPVPFPLGAPAASQPPQPARRPTPADVDAPRRGLAPDERRYVAVFSEIKKEGLWSPTPRISARAVFGTLLLDFREAQIPAGGIDIDIEVVLAEAKILLPPGVGADVDCTSMLAEVKDKTHAALPGGPTIRVHGGAILASITVVTKVPKQERVGEWRRQLRSWLGADS